MFGYLQRKLRSFLKVYGLLTFEIPLPKLSVSMCGQKLLK